MTDKIIIGNSYRAVTASNIKVTPLVQLREDSAIFVSDNFEHTPFVKWTFYNLDNTNNTINLCSGTYYKTLRDALSDNETL